MLLNGSFQFLWIVNGNNLSLIDYGYTLAQLIGFLNVVRGEKNSRPVLVKVLRQVPNHPGALDIQAAGGLV
jgi:hypothetical protein